MHATHWRRERLQNTGDMPRMFLRRRSLKKWVWLILFGWTVSSSLAVAQVCDDPQAEPAGGKQVVKTLQVPGQQGKTAPANDNHCLSPADELVGPQYTPGDVIPDVGFVSIHMALLEPAASPLVAIAKRATTLTPRSIPPYLVAHRLRI